MIATTETPDTPDSRDSEAFNAAFNATVAIDAETQQALALARHAAAQTLLNYFTDAEHSDESPSPTRLRLAMQITMRRFVPYELAARKHLKHTTPPDASEASKAPAPQLNPTPPENSTNTPEQLNTMLAEVRKIADADGDAETCTTIDEILQSDAPQQALIETIVSQFNDATTPHADNDSTTQPLGHEHPNAELIPMNT